MSTPHDLQSKQREAADLAAAHRQVADLERRLGIALDEARDSKALLAQATAGAAWAKAIHEQLVEQITSSAKNTKDVLETANAALAQDRAVAETKLAEAESVIATMRTELAQRDRAWQTLKRERDQLAHQIENVKAEDRDLAKLRRRLQEKQDTIEGLQSKVHRLAALIPPKPLTIGAAMPEVEAPPAEYPSP